MDNTNSDGNWLAGLLSTAKDTYGEIQASDAARRTANTTQNLANANAAQASALGKLTKLLPVGIGLVVLVVIVLFVMNRKS